MPVLCQTCAASQQIHLGAGDALLAPRGTTGDGEQEQKAPRQSVTKGKVRAGNKESESMRMFSAGLNLSAAHLQNI